MDELNRLDMDAYKRKAKSPFVFVLDDIRSMNNVGSAFRTADAFACEHLYLIGITACPPHREITKTALGAEDSVQWTYFETPKDCLAHLKNVGYQIVNIEQTTGSIPLFEFIPEHNQLYAFVFGNEVFGVQDVFLESSDLTLEIPQFGTKHSLNVSVTLGIIAWDFMSKVLKK